MKNLWVKDRKIVFRELYSTYIEEGYSSKEAKRLAKQEADEIMAEDQMFVNDIMDEEEIDEGTVKVTNIKWDSDDDVSDLSTTMMVPVPSGMTGDDAEEFIADYLTDKTGITHDGFRIEDAIDEEADEIMAEDQMFVNDIMDEDE